MLSALRHKSFSKIVLWFIASIIIVSFVFFGTAVRLTNMFNSAGKIYGQDVPAEDFQNAYNDSRDQAIMMYGDQFFKIQSMLDLETEAWNRLILTHEAKKQNIKVNDQDVVNAIVAMPFFQTEGRFDRYKYNELLKNRSVFGRKPKDFENGVRNQLLIRKLLENAVAPAQVTSDELRKEYTLRKEKITISYVLFNAADFAKDQKLTDDELKKFYDQNQGQFNRPATVNVQYLHLMYPANATQAQKDAVDQLAHKAGQEAAKDFDAASRNNKLEIKESGPFTLEEPLLTFAWSPEIVKEIFKLKVGQVIGPKQAPDGWQIIRLKESKPAGTAAFEEVKNQISEMALRNKGMEGAQKRAEEIRKGYDDAMAKDKNTEFKSYISSQNLKMESIPAFSRTEPGDGMAKELVMATVDLNKDKRLSSVVFTSKGPAIVYWEKSEPIDEKDFTEHQDDLRQMLTSQKHNQDLTAYLTKLKLQADLSIKVRH